MEPNNPLLKRAYELSGDPEEIRRLYADWADAYDRDTLEGMGYVAPAIAADVLAKSLCDSDRVLDAGCGTGLVGQELAKRTDADLHGIDLSADMLDAAAKKDVYSTLREADLTRPLEIADNSFDGVISVGVFTSGHVRPDALAELARVAKPGAPVVVTVHENVWDKDAYASQIEAMKAAEHIRACAITTAPYHDKENYSCKLCVMEAA
ncbi:putative TPR repeat methyltransferase [Rhodobium orientis]|uniref:SAM-dependent methyltransferase n=1 Tax=Rhodobium orientis TaxID=34017 RepID=A0A327JRV9_9HYPH|nr:class I SAM-dependent methyltransferase [Rhodobium orientis]MBB4303484.1 putative TPR repeat methyltransferase [Rhodobium orientis]MBK5950417.1 SAM-dependent methyltransferase [Rhodobium orientis]RAI28355.1 SAM-dependent methyltransferase [Rhodobium orientis]